MGIRWYCRYARSALKALNDLQCPPEHKESFSECKRRIIASYSKGLVLLKRFFVISRSLKQRLPLELALSVAPLELAGKPGFDKGSL